MELFQNRTQAGARLAEQLDYLRQENPVVLALPRGGVVAGFEVARSLGAPMDVIVCRKLGAPGQEEFGFGAVGPGGVTFLDERTVRNLRLAPTQIEGIVARELAEMQRRETLYRGGQAALDLRGRTVILIDDGLATGVTARAAIRSIRKESPRHLVLAVPVAPSDTVRLLTGEVDELVCLLTPSDFRSVGQWYEDFSQVEDEEVTRLLRLARPPEPGQAPPAPGAPADLGRWESESPKSEVGNHERKNRGKGP